MNTKIDTGICPVTGYEKQSVKCANCRHNRVVSIQRFAKCQQTKCKTKGTVCIVEEVLAIR